MAMPRIFGVPTMVPILLLSAWAQPSGVTRAQAPPSSSGYMRMVSASGHVIAGQSTDPAYNGWIPLRKTRLPSPAEMAAMAQENPGQAASADRAVHPPIVVIKDRDDSSLALLAAYTSHQHFPEIDLAVTDYGDQPAKKYKLTDAMILSDRASVTADAAQEPVEQLRIGYTKLEVLP